MAANRHLEVVRCHEIDVELACIVVYSMGAMRVDLGSGVIIEEKGCRAIHLHRCVGIALPAQDG